jgi:hypothetical protein
MEGFENEDHQMTLLKSLLWAHPTYMISSFLLYAASTFGNLASPIILFNLLNFLQKPSANVREGYLWCLALLVAQAMVAFG